MNLYLNLWNNEVCFDLLLPDGSQMARLTVYNQSELHSLLSENSSGTGYSEQWDRCLPNQFGWGLAADWLDEHREVVVSDCGVLLGIRSTLVSIDHTLSAVIAECRRRFSGAEGH